MKFVHPAIVTQIFTVGLLLGLLELAEYVGGQSSLHEECKTSSFDVMMHGEKWL